jgi:hypothetical protein
MIFNTIAITNRRMTNLIFGFLFKKSITVSMGIY